MLLSILKRLTGTGTAARLDAPRRNEEAAERANRLMFAGDRRGAIKAFREYLETDPTNVVAMNDLAACLADTGDQQEAARLFELAHSLDDNFMPATVNFAKLLSERGQSRQALPYLRRAKICSPGPGHVDAVYAGVLMRQGDVEGARHYQLQAWLGAFDNLRMANCHLFWLSYGEVDEQLLAAEHRFWANTVQPAPVGTQPAPDAAPLDPDTVARKLRIGYLSPDFRSHSVRFFFRPLLENHDRSRFDVFLYNDFPRADEQTEKMRERADHFHEVFETSDADLADLIRSHELDILVELAGHTSHNRIPILQNRLARRQMQAIGYPPTSGLTSIDAKLLDRHVVTPDSARYYAEQPLVLPGSFWCFDPFEASEPLPEPPVVANGHVTFGCVGNISKITDRLVGAWVRILAGVPDARLVIRSISFEDEFPEDVTRRRLERLGLPMDRVDLLKPEGGAAFFSSYNSVDIILDTFPFNGGTTTCFAAYMGLPVVSISGASLPSRMGLSILANLGVPELVVQDLDAYVDVATAWAREPARIREFKAQARERFRASPLGNGALFAREFEAACEDLLRRPVADAAVDAIVPLSAREIMRRAYGVLRSRDPRSAQRIVEYCLRLYPDDGPAHLLQAQHLVQSGQHAEALAYLLERVDRVAPDDRVGVRLAIARLHLLLGDQPAAAQALAVLGGEEPADLFDRLQLALYVATLAPVEELAPLPCPASGSVRFVVPCDDLALFDRISRQVSAACPCPHGWSFIFERCDEQDRLDAYERILGVADDDVVVLLQKNVQLHNPTLVADLHAALAGADVVGCWGARRWDRLDWRLDDFDTKAGGLATSSSEHAERIELQLVGSGGDTVVPGMAVLDGSLLAVRPQAVRDIPFDLELERAGTLQEEGWSNAAHKAGCRLAVHRNLGVLIDTAIALDAANMAEARMRWADLNAYDPFLIRRDDFVAVSVPLASVAQARGVCRAYLESRR